MAEVSEVTTRLLDYVLYDTQSGDDRESTPNAKKQFELTHKLAGEPGELGIPQVRISEQGYVYVYIPADLEEGKTCPPLGFIAHIDAAPSFSGKGVKPQFIRDYDGQDIYLNKEQGLWMRIADFPDLEAYGGKTLTAADGIALLGTNDKVGIAGIMIMTAYSSGHPEIKHGTIYIGFTPGGEASRGADGSDMDGPGADVVYTADGGAPGELEYEGFNVASGRVTVHGANIRSGTAKRRMRDAPLMTMESQSLLLASENPMYIGGYEGFCHPGGMIDCVREARMNYIIGDHDRAKFERRKELSSQVTGLLNQKYGSEAVEAAAEDPYYSMKEEIEPHMGLVDKAKVPVEKLDIQPIVVPVRGGTDGAGLSYMGLPYPSLCMGGHNSHGKYRFIPIQSMRKITELSIEIAGSFIEIQRRFVPS